jgi:hypothetical protein
MTPERSKKSFAEILTWRVTPSPLRARRRGAALIIVILFFVMISLAIIQSATVGVIVELRTYHTLATSKFSYVAAEAGVEDIFYRTIQDMSVPTSETITLNNASSTVTVIDTASAREIYATGDAKNEIRKVYLSISRNASASFPYGAQVGSGGVVMKQNAKVDGVGLIKGGIYSNGQIVGANGVSITGNAISSSTLAPDPSASSTACMTDEVVGHVNPNIDYAESFVMTATTSSPLAKVTLYLRREGNPNGTNIRIVADNGGKPGTTALATQELSYSSVSTSYGWVDVAFVSPPTLDPATTYWVVLDSTQDNNKYWYWCTSDTDTYVNGTSSYKQDWSTAGSWTALSGNRDLSFKLTFGGGVSKIDQVTVTGNAKADAITNAAIGQDAYYQTISGSTVGGFSHPGSLTPPYVPLPISTTTVAQWKADAVVGGTINGDCGTGGLPECNTLPLSLGPKKIAGNFDLDGGNDPAKVLTVTGTLYIAGNLTVRNKGKIKCDFAYLGNSCIVVVDGYVNVKGLATLAGSGIDGSYVLLLSTKKGCLGNGGSGCSVNDSAIAIENNVDGALFYATDSLIDISNNAIVTAVLGYQLQLQNGTEILYNSNISSLSLTPTASGVTGAWNTNRWSEY